MNNINDLELELRSLLDEIDYEELDFEDAIEIEHILKDTVRRIHIFENNHLKTTRKKHTAL